LDNSDRVTSIVNKNGTGTTLSYYDYSYDNADRVATESWSSQVGTVVYSGSHAYSYDTTNQLLGDGTHTYTYDANGNRTLTGDQTGTGNRLTTDGTYTYTYDNVGNLVQKATGTGTTWTYGYDDKNELTSVTEAVGGTTTLTVNYEYDVLGNLIQEQHWTSATGTVTVRHAYDGSNAWADVDTSNNVLARYVYGDNQDQVWARMVPSGQPNAGVAWYLTDRLGSVVDLMDGTQVLRDHIDYDPFGNVITEANASYADAYKYDAGRTDGSTGLVQFGARWYNPATGTWTSQDPLGLGPDSNPYRYVSNSPIDAIDPSGMAQYYWYVFYTKYKEVYNGYYENEAWKTRMGWPWIEAKLQVKPNCFGRVGEASGTITATFEPYDGVGYVQPGDYFLTVFIVTKADFYSTGGFARAYWTLLDNGAPFGVYNFGVFRNNKSTRPLIDPRLIDAYGHRTIEIKVKVPTKEVTFATGKLEGAAVDSSVIAEDDLAVRSIEFSNSSTGYKLKQYKYHENPFEE
jgi:RHS repeat-associated protein